MDREILDDHFADDHVVDIGSLGVFTRAVGPRGGATSSDLVKEVGFLPPNSGPSSRTSSVVGEERGDRFAEPFLPLTLASAAHSGVRS
jgi:hypothetical protein